MIVKDLDGLLHYGYGGPIVRPEPEFGTVAWALQWLPPRIAAEFDCVRGPHTWRETSSTSGELTYRFCLYCPRKERIGPTWPNTPPRVEPESLGAFSWRL